MTTTEPDLVDVYRVEHRHTAEGPYNFSRSADDRLWDMGIELSDRAHPSPELDGKFPWRELRDEHIFGFKRPEQAAKWFRGWTDLLVELGYVLAVYRVPAHTLLIGRTQLAFPRASATRTEVLELES